MIMSLRETGPKRNDTEVYRWSGEKQQNRGGKQASEKLASGKKTRGRWRTEKQRPANRERAIQQRKGRRLGERGLVRLGNLWG